MSALSIQPTYPIFTDIDGQPLEAGYVWIGTANLDPQTNPITVYWDAALTILAPQPIRTLAGYPSNNGTPARLYVNSDYSIRVMNKNGSTVYSAPAATERYSDVVVSGVNAEDVIYDPPFANAVQTNVEAKLAQTVSVKDFGAVGDGVTDDTAAFRAATATGNPIYIPPGNYLVSGCINPNSTDSRNFYGVPSDIGFGGNQSKIIFDDSVLTNTDSCIYAASSVKNIAIAGTSKNAIGIEFRRSSGVAGTFGSYNAESVWVTGCFKAYTFDSMYSSYFKSLQAYGNVHGFWVVPTLAGFDSGYFTTTVFIDCDANQNTGMAWNVTPPVKSPCLTMINCAIEGSSATEQYVGQFNGNVEQFVMTNLYIEGAGGTVGFLLLGGRGTINGLYNNATGLINAESQTANIEINSYRETGLAAGFGTWSANNVGFSLSNSVVATQLPSVSNAGFFKNTTVAGSNVPWNYQRITRLSAVTPDGSANNVFTVSFPGNFAAGTFITPFSIVIVSGGITRQICSGTLTLAYLRFDPSVTSSISTVAVSGLAKGVVTGTLSDPTFTLSGAGNDLTVQVAITSSIAGATALIIFDHTQVLCRTSTYPAIN
jgi:hypothetical protein